MAQTPFEFNVSLTNANTQYSQQLPKDTRRWSMQCRTAYDVLFSTKTSGKVAPVSGAGSPTAPYLTMKANGNAGDTLPTEQDKADQVTIYMASAQAGVVVEIWGWADQG